jgi:hypothetical protein
MSQWGEMILLLQSFLFVIIGLGLTAYGIAPDPETLALQTGEQVLNSIPTNNNPQMTHMVQEQKRNLAMVGGILAFSGGAEMAVIFMKFFR